MDNLVVQRRPLFLLRNIVSVLLAILVSFGFLLSAIGIWSRSTVLDTRVVASNTEEILKQPEVISALGNYLTDQTLDLFNMEGVLNKKLPVFSGAIKPVLINVLHDVVSAQVNNALGTARVRQTLVRLVEASHTQFLTLLRNEEIRVGAPGAEDDSVVLNLVPVLSSVLLGLQEQKLFSPRIKIPELDLTLTVEQQLKTLGDALGVKLPTEVGQLEVYKADALGKDDDVLRQAQGALSLFERGLIMLIALTVILAGAVVLIAPTKLLGLRHLSLSVLFGMAGAWLFSKLFITLIPRQIDDVAVSDAVKAALGELTSSLNRASLLLAVAAFSAAMWTIFNKRFRS